MNNRDPQENINKLEINSDKNIYHKIDDQKINNSSFPRITTSEIDIQSVLDSIKNIDGQSGATVIFIGSVRNFGINGQVQGMYYDSYIKMAENKIRYIEKMAMKKWDIKQIRIVHRIGKLSLGNNSIVIALSMPHSKDAFKACKYILAKIKQTVPIWKKEIMSNGDEQWVDGEPIKRNR